MRQRECSAALLPQRVRVITVEHLRISFGANTLSCVHREEGRKKESSLSEAREDGYFCKVFTYKAINRYFKTKHDKNNLLGWEQNQIRDGLE